MGWTFFIWGICAGLSLAVASIHLFAWIKSPRAKESLVFSITAFSATALSLGEVTLIHAQSAVAYGEILRWMHVPAGIIVVSLVWFIRLYLKTGRIWLAWLITGIRVIVLIVNFVMEPNATYQSIESLNSMMFLGETLSVPVGVMNPWRALIQLGVVLLIIYTLDATFAAYKKGARRSALVLGGSIIVVVSLSAIFSRLMVQGVLPAPLVSLVFQVIVISIFFELSLDLIRSKQLSLDLEKSQARVNLAARAANIGLWEWDLARKDIWVNEVSRARLGADATDRIDLELMLEHVHPEDREKTRQTIRQAIESGRHLSLEYRFILPDGSERWISLIGQVERGQNHKSTLMRGVSVDITALKLAELEMQTNRSALMHVQRTSSVEQLSRTLSHELNQPLGAILRNAEAGAVYLNKTPPDLSELRHIIEDICKDSKRASVVIESMRSLLKRDVLNFEPLALHELIRQTASLLNSEIQRRQASLHLDIPVELSKVHGDRVHLQQVLLNLVLNSLDAVSGQPKDRRMIDIRAMEIENDMISISVTDRGEGIQPGVLPQLFEPFRSTKEDGLGLGLAISKYIIEYHHGQIFAENNPDGGATFTFTLQKRRTVEA